MPALPPVSKVVRVDLFQTIGPNTRVRDRIFYSFTGAGPTVADLTTLATTIANSWGTNMAPAQSNQAALTGITITDLTSATGAQAVTSQNKPGTVAAASIAAGSAAVIKFKIARRYRGGHPRFYFGGLVPSQLASATQLATATISALATDFAAFNSANITTPPTNLGTLAQVNVSYFTGFHVATFPSGRAHNIPNLRGTPLQDTITGYSVNPNLASQRRRNQQSV